MENVGACASEVWAVVLCCVVDSGSCVPDLPKHLTQSNRISYKYMPGVCMHALLYYSVLFTLEGVCLIYPSI